MLLFTSGTTGKTRGVMITHRNILANGRGIVERLQLQADDRVMVVLPFCYSFGVSLVTTHLLMGACLVLDSRFMFPDKVLERMRETQCTGFAGVPSHYQSLLRRSRLKAMQFPTLRWVQQAGGRLSPPLVSELRAALPGVRVHLMYGATENTARIACLPPERLDDKPGSVGLPLPGTRVSIVDEDGAPLEPGQVGRIVVHGESVSPGYFAEPEATREVFGDGWLRTSDLGHLDEEGYLMVVDRVGDFLKCGGTRTSVKGVEDALLRCPDVVEVAVLAVPDDTLGEAVAVLVVRGPDAPHGLLERLHALAKESLPLALQPRVVHLVDALPKSDGGKVQRRALRALLEQAARREDSATG
jgi:acyl-CoA synthetase (AMP-forming)/AMP-acid ligase II